MKKAMFAVSLALLFVFAAEGFAADAKRHSWEVGVMLSGFEYEEPGVMEEQGAFYGVESAYIYRRRSKMLRAEARYCHGKVDYKNSGTMDDIEDNLFEARAMFGYDFKPFTRVAFTLYTGLGYRYLNDDSSGRLSSENHYGYERESNYLYMPIGVEMEAQLARRLFLGVLLEYDLFLMGRQISHWSIFEGYNDVENDQDDGYGIRGSVRFTFSGERIGFTVENFIRYWNIEESDLDFAGYDAHGDPDYAYEPANNSTEIGVVFKVRF